jgi:serine/threonine protein kinase
MESRQVFISYAHEDARWKNELIGRIETQFPKRDFEIWQDGNIPTGQPYAEEIRKAIEGSRVAVLLVSQRFLDGEFITQYELPDILRRSRERLLDVVWVRVSTCDWQKTDLAQLQAGHDPATPLDELEGSQLDRAWTIICERIKAAVNPLEETLGRILPTKYHIARQVARGHSAVVFEAFDRNLGRRIAIKAARFDGIQGGRFSSRVREAGRLAFDGIVTVHGAWFEADPEYCVIEYVEGESLRSLLRERKQPLAIDDAQRILIRVARALAYAHSNGIVHAYIRPSNILVDRQGDAYISMLSGMHGLLGSALVEELLARGRPTDQPDLEDLTYLAPEDFASRRAALQPSPSVDQFLLGLVGYEMISGRRPQLIPSLRAVLDQGQAAFGSPAHLGEVTDEVPSSLADVIMRMIQLDPAARFPRMDDVLRQLEAMQSAPLEIVRDSLRRIVAQGAMPFLEKFYQKFLTRSGPEVRARFARLASHHQAWNRQYEMLEEAIVLLLAFNGLGQGAPGSATAPIAEPTVLSRIARRHASADLDVRPEWYAPFVDALVETVAEVDPGIRGDPEKRVRVMDAWRAAVRPGIEYMKSRYRG